MNSEDCILKSSDQFIDFLEKMKKSDQQNLGYHDTVNIISLFVFMTEYSMKQKSVWKEILTGKGHRVTNRR